MSSTIRALRRKDFFSPLLFRKLLRTPQLEVGSIQVPSVSLSPREPAYEKTSYIIFHSMCLFDQKRKQANNTICFN